MKNVFSGITGDTLEKLSPSLVVMDNRVVGDTHYMWLRPKIADLEEFILSKVENGDSGLKAVSREYLLAGYENVMDSYGYLNDLVYAGIQRAHGLDRLIVNISANYANTLEIPFELSFLFRAKRALIYIDHTLFKKNYLHNVGIYSGLGRECVIYPYLNINNLFGGKLEELTIMSDGPVAVSTGRHVYVPRLPANGSIYGGTGSFYANVLTVKGCNTRTPVLIPDAMGYTPIAYPYNYTHLGVLIKEVSYSPLDADVPYEIRLSPAGSNYDYAALNTNIYYHYWGMDSAYLTPLIEKDKYLMGNYYGIPGGERSATNTILDDGLHVCLPNRAVPNAIPFQTNLSVPVYDLSREDGIPGACVYIAIEFKRRGKYSNLYSNGTYRNPVWASRIIHTLLPDDGDPYSFKLAPYNSLAAGSYDVQTRINHGPVDAPYTVKADSKYDERGEYVWIKMKHGDTSVLYDVSIPLSSWSGRNDRRAGGISYVLHEVIITAEELDKEQENKLIGSVNKLWGTAYPLRDE